MLTNKTTHHFQSGETMISVIVILFQILAAIFSYGFIANKEVGLNPSQQLASSRDAGRMSVVTQMRHASEAYFTSNKGKYPNETNWAQELVDKGELSKIPDGVDYGIGGVTACTSNAVPNDLPNYCYKTDGKTMIVYATLESDSNFEKCSHGTDPFTVYSSADGRGGVICSAGEPFPSLQEFVGN